MDARSHLRLAEQNQRFAENLARDDTEASWRWATVVAYYAAHHFAHSLFATQSRHLPRDISRGNGRLRVVSHVHPERHGTGAGGTRQSLLLLSGVFKDLDPLNMTYRAMLATSFEARYGLEGRTMTRITRGMADTSLARLHQVQTVIARHLR